MEQGELEASPDLRNSPHIILDLADSDIKSSTKNIGKKEKSSKSSKHVKSPDR